MTGWYADYFTADYWSFARHEYTAERTAGEVAYLAETLREHAPGRRVLDLGCGVGRHTGTGTSPAEDRAARWRLPALFAPRSWRSATM
ncbi:hypothetical protein ACWDR9_36815, partial [Streptosporangium sandarakinum]